MARRLRAALSSDGMDVSHSKSLEVVSKAMGYGDWNTTVASFDLDRSLGDKFYFTKSSPILRIFEERKAKEFYCDFLGFEITYEHRSSDGMPLYLGLDRAGLSLHLSEHHGDASPGANVFVVTKNIRDFHRELAEKRYAYNRPGLEDLPWGLQMQVHDPFGNRIRFCQQDN